MFPQARRLTRRRPTLASGKAGSQSEPDRGTVRPHPVYQRKCMNTRPKFFESFSTL
jgi:hypothetical protein